MTTTSIRMSSGTWAVLVALTALAAACEGPAPLATSELDASSELDSSSGLDASSDPAVVPSDAGPADQAVADVAPDTTADAAPTPALEIVARRDPVGCLSTFALDEAFIYYVKESNIVRSPKGGGTPEVVLARPPDSPCPALAIGSDYLYFGTNGNSAPLGEYFVGSVSRVPKTGGEALKLLDAQVASLWIQYPFGFFTSEVSPPHTSAWYPMERFSDTAPLLHDTVEEFAWDYVYRVVFEGDQAWWLATVSFMAPAVRIVRSPLDVLQPEQVAAIDGRSGMGGLEIAGTEFVFGLAPSDSEPAQIVRMPRSGGDVTVIATTTWITGPLVDDGWVYWDERDDADDYRLMRVSLLGGAPEVIAENTGWVPDLQQDDTHLYFAGSTVENGTPSPVIYRYRK